MVEKKNKLAIDRRKFLKLLGASSAVAATSLVGCKTKTVQEAVGVAEDEEMPTDKMTYRVTPHTGDKVSLLGYGCMRLPMLEAPEGEDPEIDQEEVNRHVDFAIEHGVNYFDTAPVYCKGRSEHVMGIALSRRKREEYFIATKLSNFAPDTWPFEKSKEMYLNSLKELQVDYIDYMLLHAVGGGEDSMKTLKSRYFDNGALDFLAKEREAGRIRNLGFSYHGDVKIFDYLLSLDDQYHWDFVQIQLNYLDWEHAAWDANAEYLYEELHKRNIPAVIMEPLRGGGLVNLPFKVLQMMNERDANATAASWAFRFAGSPEGVLTVLSGMTYMDHLKENIRTFSPIRPLNDDEHKMLMDAANLIIDFPLIKCTGCQYCMPCPYGLDIPSIFAHYNKCINEGNYAEVDQSEEYRRARRAYLVSYDRAVPRERQADKCVGCKKCLDHCPQRINIPQEMVEIDEYVEQLKRNA